MTATKPPIKIILACPGVGLVQRGFERMFADLFQLLKDDLDVTLYKGGGSTNEQEVVLHFLPRNGWFLRSFPIHKLVNKTSIHAECFTFALALLWKIRKQKVDIIHCTDPPLARFLYKLRNRFNLKFALLYSEACAMPPTDYPPADHMQQISQITYEHALTYKIPADYQTVIPLGTYPHRFVCFRSKADLRAEYGIADDTFVILSLAAINRVHKRIDHLIDEASQLHGNLLIWLDGSLDQGDPSLLQEARAKLGERCRITHLPSNKVPELFAMADILVHCAHFEAFGLALIEAAVIGVPLLTHNAPHFCWLINNDHCHVDMLAKGELTAKLQYLLDQYKNNPTILSAMTYQQPALTRFDWQHLKAEYLALYQRVYALPENQRGIAHEYGLS